MLPSELKLTNLSHCYIHLPGTFVARNNSIIKTGSIIIVRSIQKDVELYVMWNGQVSSGKYAQLDIDFAKANNLEEELIVLSFAKDLRLADCSLCRVELVEATDYSILSQHVDANVLDTCKLVSKDLVLPIWLSQHVKVLVKVIYLEPDPEFGILTKWTEMQYHHSSNNITGPKEETDVEKDEIVNPVPIISCSLGVDYTPKFCFGPMLVCGERGSGKTHFLKIILKTYRRFKSEIINCRQLRGKRVETIKKTLADFLVNALDNQPFILALDDIDSIVSSEPKHESEKGQEAIYKKRLVDVLCHFFKQLERSTHEKGNRVAIIASCRRFESLDERISKSKGRQFFGEIVNLAAPNQEKKVEILKNIISEYKQIKLDMSDEELDRIAKRCNSFMPSDLRRLVERSFIGSCSRSLNEFNSEPLKIIEQDLLNSLEGYLPYNLRGITMQSKTSRTFDDVGGMSTIKDSLKKNILIQIKYPNLFKRCPLRIQTSILLYGPPGCGKTLIAEALTNEESLNSICVRGPELLSKYIGASEGAVRDVFRRAELARPCVIFFDEFESLVSRRGADSTGVTDRIVNQFLTLMDGVERLSRDIFIIAATSRPDMIDPAILRPGRLDRHIYCGPPDQNERLDILRVLSRNITMDSDLSFPEWAKRLITFTGADIQALLYSAQMKALHEILDSQIGETDKGGLKRDKGELEIKVAHKHMDEAYEDMKKEVEVRYASFASRYPKAIRGTNRLVAARATLA